MAIIFPTYTCDMYIYKYIAAIFKHVHLTNCSTTEIWLHALCTVFMIFLVDLFLLFRKSQAHLVGEVGKDPQHGAPAPPSAGPRAPSMATGFAGL